MCDFICFIIVLCGIDCFVICSELVYDVVKIVFECGNFFWLEYVFCVVVIVFFEKCVDIRY